MRTHRTPTAILVLVMLCLGVAGWVYFAQRDTPPQSTVTGARLQWVRGLNDKALVGRVRLRAADAKRLDQLIAAGPEPLSGSVNCPMDTGRGVRVQFTNSVFAYPTFTIKLDGCSGTPGHQLTEQLAAFLNAHQPK